MAGISTSFEWLGPARCTPLASAKTGHLYFGRMARAASSGFAIADVTLEPPAAWPVAGDLLAGELRNLGLAAVGHTAYYLPIASPFPRVRQAAHVSMLEMFDVFALAGIERVNVHPDPLNRLFAAEEVQARNA